MSSDAQAAEPAARCIVRIAIAIVFALYAGGAVAQDALRDWTPADSVSLAYYSPPDSPVTTLAPGYNAVLWNRQHTYFLVTRFSHDLNRDEKLVQLDVWSAQDVERALRTRETNAPRPIQSVRRGSSNNDPAMQQIRFDDDGNGVLFLGQDAAGTANAFRLDITSGQIRQLSREGSDVAGFSYRGGSTIFWMRSADLTPRPLRYPMEPVARTTMFIAGDGTAGAHVLTQSRRSLHNAQVHRSLSAFARQRTHQCQLSQFTVPVALSPPLISPNGRYAVTLNTNATQGPSDYGSLRALLTDLTNCAQHRLGASDFNATVKLVWDPSSRFLAAVGRSALESATQQTVSIINADSGDRREVALLDLTGNVDLLEWNADGLLVANEEGASIRVTSMDGASWTVSEAAPSASDVSVLINQSTNEPANLSASAAGRSITLLPPDELLRSVWWARSQLLEWTDGAGRRGQGGLLLPRTHSAGHRIPLVIQAYIYEPSLFLPDGPHVGTADSAQSLVANGFAVLQIGLVDGSVRSFSAASAGIDAAIDALDSQGIVDSSRVAITGFSMGGGFVYYLITHPGRHRLRAAVSDDATTRSYSEYLLNSANAVAHARLNYGLADPTANFWNHREDWLRGETTFNVDNVVTPILFTRHNASASYSVIRDEYSFLDLQTIGAFDINDRPIEFLYFRDGAHELQRPREIVALHASIIEWMRFWLRDELPADPQFADRWSRLRDQQARIDQLTAPTRP